MVSKYPKFIALSLMLMLVISGIAYFVMLTAQNYSPLARMKNAQDVAKMSGEYQFRTDIDQVSGYAPSITNYGRESRHDQMVVEGTISESTQTSTMTISNANGVMLEVRRERGQTYARQPGTGWQRTASNSTAQINTLSYLAGMTNAKVVGSDGNSFDFGFDGNAFATHFARLLSADAAHGIKYSDEWYSIAQSNQFKEANGDGNLTLDSDGLPKNMTLNLTMPGNNNNGTVQTSIKTSFFAYARTGLALKKVLNNPFTIVGNLLGTDTSAVKTVLFSLLAVLAVTMIGALVHLFRTRLYLPVTLLALGMLVFQPFSTIPRSYAATSEESAPTPGPDSTTPSKPEVTFNPLVSPLAQAGSVVLPSAGTTTANDTVVVSGSQSRSLTTRDASSPVSCTTLTDSNKNMDADDDGLTNEQECVTYETLPNNADSDADRLNDFAEVQLGTNPKVKDTDLDTLSDYVEVAFFTQYPGTTNKFYTNPLNPDTNGDGIGDMFECPEKLILNENVNITGGSTNCTDTNGDNIPDFITFDNDADGVSDSADSLPSVNDVTIYSESNPYALKIQNTATTTVQPLIVDVQIRPTANLLYANNAIYDWPSNDKAGQVTRVRDTTFQSYYNTTDPKSTNGDIKVTAMLEIKIPISNVQYGNLPVTACSNYVPITKTLQLNSTDTNSCINMKKTQDYGISVSWSHDSDGKELRNNVTLGVPLIAIYDTNGTITSYSAQAYYETSNQSWLANHEIRLQWNISSIQDYCPENNENCDSKERIQYTSTLQSYYSGFKVVGIKATELYGVNAAVIYEDSSQASVTDPAQRRLAIIKASNYLDAAFVKKPFLTIDGTDITKSIPVIFDNTINKSSTITSTVKDATKVIVQTYPTSLEIVKISSDIETKILSGINKTTCTNSTEVKCRPAMIIATATTERSASLTSNKTIDFATIAQSVTRGIKGMIYKLDENSKWQVASPDDYAPEIAAVQSVSNQSTINGTKLTPKQLADLNQGYIFASITLFQRPQVANYTVSEINGLLTNINASDFAASTRTTNWSSQFNAFYTTFQNSIDTALKKQPDKTEAKVKDKLEAQTAPVTSTRDSVLFASSFVQLVKTDIPDVKFEVGTGAVGVALAATSLALSFASNYAVFNDGESDASTGKYNMKDRIGIASGTIQLTAAVVTGVTVAVQWSKAAAEAASLTKLGVKATTYQVFAMRAIDAASKASKFAKVMQVAGPLLQIGAALAVGIMTAMNAEYAYQVGNAISSMIGQILAIIFIAVLSSIPGFGQIFGAIMALLDGIAAAACAGLSEKDKRSTASKWLCGGATGILANFFTPYASNVIVDSNDSWSRYRKIDSTNPKLENTAKGFRVGNGMINGITVTDYIERMPFPSSWQALFWAWQWNALDERSTSTNYVLSPQQTDFNYSISVGSQVNQWQRNSTCPSTPSAADCAYYKDGEKTYSWRKPVTIAYTSQFTDSGINTKLPDLYVSQAIKVPQQTCISIPIFFIFLILIPICWTETHTAKPDYININDGSPTQYDILPATIDQFVSMRLRNAEAGYTFAWSPDTAEPPFPIFKDADNDGLSNEQEKIYGTRDNTYDTDGDGISDNREVALTTNPVLKDSDNDGLTDDLELQMGTNPSMPDSDGDGLLDGEEVMHVEKGIRVGGWEVTYAIIANQPQTTWISSDPLRADADGDQITDLREKVLGWSPYAKNSGDIMTVGGSVREALLPTIQVGFDSNSISTAFSSSGFVSSNVQCVSTNALTTAIDCPNVANTDRPLPNSNTKNPFVTLTSAYSLDVGNGPQSNFNSQFTIAAWLKPSAPISTKLIINRDNLIKVYQTSAGAVEVQLTTTKRPDTKNPYTLTTADSVLPAGSWKHLAVTYDNQALVVYVDGVEVGRVAVAGNLSTTPNQKLIVGNGYVGGIDDIAVYQVALRAGEITQLKNGALTGGSDLVVKPGDRLITSITQDNKLLGRSIQGYSTISGVSVANGFESNQIETASLAANTSTSFDSIMTVPGVQNLSTTPSTYANSCVYAGNELCVKFDETASSTTTFTDLSSNQNNLVCTTTNCPTLANSGWNFSTTSNSGTTTLTTKVAVGNAISARDFTIAAWVRPEGQSTVLRPIVNSSNSNNPNAFMQVALNTEIPQFSMGSATALVASNTLPIDSWSHVLYTFAAGKRSIYVNGVIVATDATAIAYPGSFGVLNVGKDAGSNSFNGSLRDLQIYSNALNLRQITALANTCEDPQLIACLPLNGSANDMSVYGTNEGVALVDFATDSTTGALTNNTTRFPNGYAKLISDHDFTMVAKVKLGSTADQTIMQTAPAVASGNQFKVATVSGIATLSVGTTTLTAGSLLFADIPYIITARFRAGVWSLRVERVTQQTTTADFSMTSRVAVGDNANNQTIMQNGVVLNSPNQYQVTTDDRGNAILKQGETILATGPTLNKNTTYTITAIFLNGAWSLTATNATPNQSTTTSVVDTTLRQAQEPISIGQSGMTINNIRIYRTAVSDTTLAAVARNALFGTLSVALNNPPVSDLLQISVDARGKVINPDANFERIRGNCDAETVVVCLPFTGWDNFPSADMTGATATQSSTLSGYPASNAIDGNQNSFSHTQDLTNAWLDIDLGSSKEIRNIVVTNRLDCCQERIKNAFIFLSNTRFGSSTTTTTNITNSVAWKTLGCNDQAQSCYLYKNYMTVTFPTNTKARYIRVQLKSNLAKVLQIGELKINQKDVFNCQSNGACPTISNGGANFTTGKRVSITPDVSKATFEGDKNFTVMTWVRFNAISGEQAIMYDRSDVNTLNNALSLGISAGKLYISYYQNALTGNTTLQPNTWYHVAFVKNGTTRLIYLNGQLEARDPVPTVAGLVSAREMFIGERNNDTSSLNGTLRDFQIHNTALNIDATLLTADIAKAATTNAFELQVPFDEPAVSTQFSDVLTTGLSLSCLSATDCPLSGQPGRDDRAVHFDGGQGLRFNPATNTGAYVDYINKTTNPNYTISMWVRPSAYGTWLLGNDTITQKLRVGINKDGYLSYEQGRDFNTNAITAQNNATIKWPAAPLLSSQKLPLNSWSHITVSTTNNAEYVYVNGVVTSRGVAAVLAMTGSTVQSTTAIVTGKIAVATTNTVDPIEYSDSIRKGYTFTSTSKTLSLGRPHPLQGATSASIGMWIKPTSVTGTQYIFDNWYNYAFQIVGNQLQYFIATSGAGAWTTATGITLTNNQWQYLSLVIDPNKPSAQQLQIQITPEINGVLGTTTTFATTAPSGSINDYTDYTGSSNFVLGSSVQVVSGATYFNGTIANVIIAPRAFSASELTSLRTEPLNASNYGAAQYTYVNGTLTNTTPAFKDPITAVAGSTTLSTIGLGQTIVNSPTSTNVNAPTVINETVALANNKSTTVSGYAFNNTTKAISLGQSHPLNGATSATIGMWVKPTNLATYGDSLFLYGSVDYQFLIGTDGQLYFALDTSTGVPVWDWIATGMRFTSDKWQYFSMVLNANEPDASKKLTVRIDQADGTNPQIRQYAATGYIEDDYPCDLFLGGPNCHNLGRKPFTGSIGNLFITPRALSDTELATLRSEPLTLANARKYGNADAPAPTVNLAETFAGDLDELHISPIATTAASTVQADMKQAPNWNLTFEESLNLNRTELDDDGISKVIQINAVTLPNDVPGRAGINRFSVAASCDTPEISGVECPIGNTVGMAGTASVFNGTNTMLQVGNGTTLIDEIKNGGTIQLMIKPDKLTGTQTLLHYGNTSGNTAFQVQIVDDKVKLTLGNTVFTSSTKLDMAWNQISFSFGANGLKYFQNGTEQDTRTSASKSLFTSTVINSVTYPIATQSSTLLWQSSYAAQKILDGDIDTFQHTDTEAQPWLEIDLGTSTDINSLDIYNRNDNYAAAGYRIGNGIIFASNTSFGTRKDIATMKTSAGVNGWRNIGCNNQAATCNSYAPIMRVGFPTGFTARYLRIQSPDNAQFMHLGEIKGGTSPATIVSNSAYKLWIGGKIISGNNLSEMFQGGIEEITFTPSTLAPAKVFRIARSQFSQTMTKTDNAIVIIDAEPPSVTIKNSPYVGILPQQFIVATDDESSSVVKVSTKSSLNPTTSMSTATSKSTSNPTLTKSIDTPPCTDAVAGSAYCPTFGFSQSRATNIEGKYTLTSTATDEVGNVGTGQSTILVDTTPPTATLIRPTGPITTTYKTTWAPNENMPELTIKLSASDPVLTNSGNSAGSGVKSLSVNLKDAAGRLINKSASIPATLNAGVWTATIPVPFGNPSGFYQVGAIVTDNVGNQSNEIMVADANTMIEVDSSAPRDVITYPSPYNPDNYFVGNQTITGRVSDIGDGRTALQQGLRIRLDFEAPDGAQAFDNRADSRYNTSCSTCPVIAPDGSSSNKIARFNIDNSVTAQQALTVANAATVLTGTFSIALMAKINDVGTLISTGVASNPRLRIQVSKVGSAFQVTAKKGNVSVKTPATLVSNTWYYLIYSEYRDGTTSSISLASGSNLATLTTATATYTGALPPVQPDITIGAMQSTAGDTRKEDFFRGYIDDVLLSPSQLVTADLIGKALAQGSGTQRHLTRLAIDDDGYTGNDRLTDSVDFYMPMNQSSLPIVDAIKGLRSSRCTADTTVVPNTCPLLSEGFASNAVLLQRNSDGIKTDYQLQTSATTAKSMALRFKIGVAATSGLLAWLQAPSTSDSLAMQIGYNKDLQSVTVRINDKNATLLATSEATTAINDNDWHTMVITSTGSDTNEQISVYIDGTLVVTKTIAGHWVNATLGLGALTDVSGYSGRDTATAAAINTAIDDLAIFSTALTSANIIDYSFGYSTVYHETFDNGRITPGAITSDDSPYHQPSTITSSDANLNSVVGTVGSAAIAFDGNDEVIHRDPNTLTFAPYNQPWSLSAWVTPKDIYSFGAWTIIKGSLNNYSYELRLDPGKKRPIFTMAGMFLESYSPLSTSSASHIIVSSDGTTLTMYVNGTSVASTATSIGSNVFTRTPAIIPFDSKSQSSTDGSNPAGNGYDGNLSTYSLTTNETNPYWVMSNPNSTAMDNVTIYSRVPGQPLSNFTLFVSDTLPDMTSSDRFNLVTTASKWSYRMNGTVSDRVTIPLPIGTTGKHVIIIADGANRTIALNDVQITLLPTIKIGTGFTGTIDDVRIYRKALTAADRFRLGAMAWQQSATTTENGYTTWSRPAIAGVEVNTSIQSMTVDNNDNSLVTAGERSLWNGTMDSFNPRITTTNVDGNYTVNVSDRNLSPQQMATPCGNKLTVNYQLPPSLWFLQNMSVLDGTYNSPTSLTGSCTFASVPELIRTNSQVISTTNALVYGNRYGYVGGINNIAVVDVLAGQRMTKGSVTVAGTVNHLIINEAKTKLYAISTAGTLNTLTIFDIATNPTTPAQLGALAIPSISAGATVAKLGITTNQNGDWYLILADTSSPQKYFSIDVSSPRSPTIATTTTPSIDTRTAMDMAAQNDLVVVAYGDTGIIIYRVADGGALNAVQSFNSTGYANKLFFNGNSLAIFSDDEPSNATTTPTSANVLITMNLIASVSATGEAALTSPLAEQNSYMHSTPIDGDNVNVNWYRMVDAVPYRPNEFMVLSADVNNPGNQRISIINTAESDAYLVSDTQLTVTTPVRVATNSQSVAVLARQAAITSLAGYQVSDARLATYACDILNNCTTVASTVTTTQKLGIDPPLQASVRLINQVNAYTTGTQRIYVSGEAPLGISEMSLVSDTQILATIAITGTPTQMERSFDINLPSGIYTLKAQLKDGQANVITSPAMRTVVDLSAPQIKLIDGVIGESLLVNNYFLIRAVITDDIGLDNLQIINTLPNAPPIPYTLKHRDYNSTCKCVVTDVTAIYNRRATDAKGLPLRIIANDAAGRSTINTSTVIFDTVPPVISDGTVKATLNGVVTPLTDGQTVSAIASANLNVGWSKIADVSPILLNKLEYTVKTLSSTTNYSATLDTKSALTLPAGQFSGLTTAEASRVTFGLRVRDSLGNELLSNLPSVYVDAPTTPDYTLMNSTEPTYRGFVNNGCAALGEDRRPGLNNIQRFAMTWDSQAIRLNWQGANWDYDGDLFIYLDTVTGGTVKAYRPTSYTQSISNSVALGESFITLPVNMAVRNTGSTSSVKDYVNNFQTALSQSRQGNRAGTISGGADYVIHVKDSTTASILRWNGSDWVDTNVTPSYRAVNELGIEQTDIRALFSSIGYVVGQPLGVVAFATTPTKFMPWTSFPITNPIRTEQGTNPIAITPMLNGFGWSNLNAGVCPKTAALNPDTTQVITSLTSTPNGVFNRAMADSFTNTEPDAISQIISDTAELCDALTTNNWCTTVSQYGTAINNGSGLLDALASTLASEQDPVVGNNSVVTYTLTIQNPTNKPTRTIYGIVQTYGGIWLTNQNSTGTPATAIIGGGNYDYHTITASNLRDYQVIRIAPMAANSSQTLTLQARIDPSKAQPTDSDRLKTSSIAKIEVRLTDDSTGTTPDNIKIARTIEWLNAAVAIDSSAPERVTPDTQTIVKRGAVTITGGLSDASSVPAVTLEYYTNVNANRIPVSCGASVLGRWSCPVTVANGVSNLSYRVRASDVYNQQSQWSPWYNAIVDVTAPSFSFTPQTTSMFAAAYVGGSAISLGGTVSDTNSIATIKVCDESQPTCDFGTTTNPTTVQSVISNTVTLAQEVTAQPCAATEFASYTMLPNTISTAAPQARVGSLTVDVNATSLAADELNLWLQSPSGTLTPLMTSVRSGMVNFNGQFSDSASTTTASLIGTTSITGTATLVKPDGLLSRFGGEPVNGTWQLLACDRNENSTRTTINQWKITLTSSGNTVSNNAPWTYTVKNTANIDNQMRILNIYALDNYNNLSPATVVALTIDTVAPSVTVSQLANSLLPGSQATLFQGTLSDGGSINGISANVYDSSKLVQTVNITTQSVQSQTLARMNYLQGRAAVNYTWQFPIDAGTLAPGTYRVQFVATDVAGNQRTTDAYTFTVTQPTAPSLQTIQMPATHQQNTFALQYVVDTGSGPTTVVSTVAFDGNVNVQSSDTTLQMWDSSGVADSTAQAQIPTSLQNTQLRQLEMNNHLAAALDNNGTLTMWELQNSNTVVVAPPTDSVMQLSNVTQFAMGDSSNQHLLTLSSTGIITDYTPAGATTVAITDAVAIAAGTTHNLAIIKTGQLVAWGGTNSNGETTIPISDTMGISQIAAGDGFSLALKSDGRLIAWGKKDLGQTTVPVTATTGIMQIAAGDKHGLALRADGVVVAWGDNSLGQITIPVSVTNALYIAANANSSAAVTRDGKLYVWGATTSVESCCYGTTTVALNGTQILTNQVTSNITQSNSLPASLDLVRTSNQFTGLLPGRRYKYTLTVSNSAGSASYSGTFTPTQSYDKLYLPFLTNTDGATAVNTTSGK